MKKTVPAILFVLTSIVLGACAPAATAVPAPAADPKLPSYSRPAATSPAALPPASSAPQQAGPAGKPGEAVAPSAGPSAIDSSELDKRQGIATAVPLNNPSFSEPETGEGTSEPVFDHGNEFQGYGINDYENAKTDNLSTFALDVDTASYSMARKYIKDGNLPPAEAIRVEEFVNSFESGYAAPEDATFALFADGAPSPFVNDGTYLIRFGVKGYEVPDYARKPLALTFVIDVSGSMGDNNRLGMVKDSLKLLVKRLRASDTVAIVVYGSDARLEMENRFR